MKNELPGADPQAELGALRRSLHESEERFRSLFSAAATGICTSTPDGRYLEANAAYCQMLGYSEDELKQLEFSALTHPDDLQENLKLRDELLAGTRDSFFLEKRYVKKGGAIVWVGHSVSATHGPDGEVTALLVIAENISERKLAEQALRYSEERLRLITDLVPHGIFVKDSVGRHIFANPALAELAGLSVAEILGRDDFALVADKAQAEAYRADDRAVLSSGRKMVISEEPRTDLSGRTRLLQTIKLPFQIAETDEPAVLGVCMDITEQKRTEARFRRLVDSNIQGVFFWNTNGQTTGANDAFLNMVGYTREELGAGRIRWADMTPPELRERDERALRECASKGVSEPYEKEFIRKDASRIPVLIGAAVFEDNRDEGVAFVLDLSERKELEQQFLRAQRMESLGTLAGGIAHDLNNILAPIMMSIDTLKSELHTKEAGEILETIAESAQRGADIVRQVLSFARGVEGQRTQVHPKQIFKNLEDIIKDTFPKNIQLVFSVPDDVWMLFADATQVHQILLNLCVNARDAMPDGGRLTIECENRIVDDHYVALDARAKAGRYVCISVTDSGTGIPAKIIDKIFEPFFTTKEVDKGTGLGLSTVMAIVKSHEGIINVYSEPGKGTTFRVFLPAREGRAEGEQQARPTIPLRGNGETILIADDEDAILDITRRTLEHHGYRVLCAQNGADAVAVYAEKKDQIAIVLTDMRMPIMDGASLIRVLLRMNPAVKIVKASGFSSNLDGDGFVEAGVKATLAKPYTTDTLLRCLRSILETA